MGFSSWDLNGSPIAPHQTRQRRNAEPDNLLSCRAHGLGSPEPVVMFCWDYGSRDAFRLWISPIKLRSDKGSCAARMQLSILSCFHLLRRPRNGAISLTASMVSATASRFASPSPVHPARALSPELLPRPRRVAFVTLPHVALHHGSNGLAPQHAQHGKAATPEHPPSLI